MMPHVIPGPRMKSVGSGIYPPGRPDGLWAPQRVDARHEAAHDDGGGRP
jgi:hypothetical protein